MVASESDLKRMWEGSSKIDKHWILDNIYMSADGVEDETYEKILEHCANSKTREVFKNSISYIHPE